MNLYYIRNQLNNGKSVFDIPLRVTFYARVSTETNEQMHSLKAQIQYYNELIKKNTIWEYVDGYIDEGLSGTSAEKREQFLHMINDAKLNKFNLIVTKEISRFSRNTLDSIKYTQELLASGVGVLFQSDNINTFYPDSELRLTLMSSIAQDEVRKISERVRFGFKRSIEKGVVLGNNKIWGYKKNKGKLIIVEEEAEIIRLIFDLYVNKGIGIRSIVKAMSEYGYKNSNGRMFSFSTINGILTNPKYKGYYCGNKTIKYDYRCNNRRIMDSTEWVLYKDYENVPPIVDEHVWDRANQIHKQRSEKIAGKSSYGYSDKYSYSGKIICAEHNTPYHRTEFKSKNKVREAWRCKKYAIKGKTMCDSPTVYTDELDNIARKAIALVLTDKDRVINEMLALYSGIKLKSSINEDITKIQLEINKLLSMKDKLLDLTLKGKVSNDEFKTRSNKFNCKITELNERIIGYEQQKDKNNVFLNNIELIHGVISNELCFNESISNNVINGLFDKMKVYKTDEKNVVNIKIFLKIADLPIDYRLTRQKGNATVSTVFRSASYI